MAKTLGRDVLGRKHGRTLEVRVAEWDGSITIRQLSHREVVLIQGMAQSVVDASTQRVADRGKLTKFNFELIKRSWVDDTDEPVLTDDDYDALIDEPNSVIKVLVEAISEFNGLTESAKADAEKNS